MENARSFRSVLLEVFSIVLGVLLALGVSEWQEQRSHDELARVSLHNIRGELSDNLATLKKIHKMNAETVAIAKSIENTESDEQRQFSPGVQLRSTAWEAMLSSGVSNYVDYETLLALSDVYSMQAVYRETGMKLVDASMTMSAMAAVNATELDNEHFVKQFMGYFEMVLSMEEGLLEAYSAADQKLSSDVKLMEAE